MNHALARLGGLLALLCMLLDCRGAVDRNGSVSGGDRIVSLSPALTETLFALGLGAQVVAVSDYCHEPSSVEDLPRVGSMFTPRLEAIVVARPTAIVAERVDGTNIADLERLSPTLTYRWLAYDDVLASTRALGNRFGKHREAEQLIGRYERALKVDPSAQAPRILLVMAHVPGQLSELWFIRKNSIHGRALEAAGARNAVAEDVVGPPRLGLERAIALDPDGVIVVQPRETGDQALLDDYRRLTAMRAVREQKLALVAAPELEVPGPRIARFVERLRSVVSQWGGK